MGLNSMLCMNGGAPQKMCCIFGRSSAKHVGKLMESVTRCSRNYLFHTFFLVKHLPTVDMFVEAN